MATREPILVINAGSSSIKFSLFENAAEGTLTARAHGQVEGIGNALRFDAADPRGRKLAAPALQGNDHHTAIAAIHDWFVAYAGGDARLAAVGHRVVHGGSQLVEPVLIDDRVLAALEGLTPLAPLHQPHHVAGIRAMGATFPKVPQAACFDTAFHQTQPKPAQEFALPRDLSAKGIRRYGFHGISYEYIISALAQVAPDVAHGKLVVAHLGNGASLCAVEDGRSMATTMGFTPLDGLVMGTRAGLIDPGVIFYLQRHEGMSLDDVEALLWDRSGLLGVSNV